MFKRLQARRENWYFIDTMARGYYHPYAKSVWKHHGFDSLEITEEDKEILKEGQLDFVSFSYYRINKIPVFSSCLKTFKHIFWFTRCWIKFTHCIHCSKHATWHHLMS